MSDNFICNIKSHLPCNQVDWLEAAYCGMHSCSRQEAHCDRCGKIVAVNCWSYEWWMEDDWNTLLRECKAPSDIAIMGAKGRWK